MSTLSEFARDPRKAMADLEKKFGVEPGGLLREMDELAAEIGDWRDHLPFDVACSYYDSAKARAPFQQHVNGCNYCKRLLEAVHPTSAPATAENSRREKAAKTAAVAVAGGFVVIVVSAWLLFSS
jgi:hypothetical protein